MKPVAGLVLVLWSLDSPLGPNSEFPVNLRNILKAQYINKRMKVCLPLQDTVKSSTFVQNRLLILICSYGSLHCEWNQTKVWRVQGPEVTGGRHSHCVAPSAVIGRLVFVHCWHSVSCVHSTLTSVSLQWCKQDEMWCHKWTHDVQHESR